MRKACTVFLASILLQCKKLSKNNDDAKHLEDISMNFGGILIIHLSTWLLGCEMVLKDKYSIILNFDKPIEKSFIDKKIL